MKTYSDEDILHFVDGTLNEALSHQIERDIELSPELAQRIDAMQASQLPYSMAYKNAPIPAMPDEVRNSLDTWAAVAKNASTKPLEPKKNNIKIASLVGLVGLSFLIGYLTGTTKITESISTTTDQLAETIDSESLWVQRVADYQSLYVGETVAGIKNGRESADVLLNKLQQEDHLNGAIPDLSEFGYSFVRAQQLGFFDEPLLQLVYTSPGKKPLALCFMPDSNSTESSINTKKHETLGSANWRQSSQRYVIVAEEPLEQLEKMARHARQILL